ncbi:MAG: UvrD-helicase domain-containing protein [bacterium]|nr:UvrD-helicase domain-containing protein [bacterium]MCP4799023.1 UvrD-helicase domain-containing protein [bacterium]
MNYLDNLNDRQKEAVICDNGPMLVIAGAGSGKTRVLTSRITWLLDQQKASPWEILAFTFTNKAASEMKERVVETTGAENAPPWIGTFHATGVKLLRREYEAAGLEQNFVIYDTDDSTRMIRQIMKDIGIDKKQFAPKMIRNKISSWKNEDIDPVQANDEAVDFRDEKIASVYEIYESKMRQSNALDFDDLILRTVKLLHDDDAVREKYASRFKYVLVDEFQDTNPLQMLMISMLSSYHNNLFAVGDDDQSIYSWRGARIENMLNFNEYFSGAGLIKLEQNYRSTGNILNAANAVIGHNKSRKGKTLWTAGDAGVPLRVEQLGDEEDEAALVAEIIQNESDKGRRRGDITILYRTNAQSRMLEDSLRRASIPHQVVGATAFYERREIRDILAYLKIVNNPADSVNLGRIINVPKRRIGDATVEKLLAIASENQLTPGAAAAQSGLLESDLPGAACERLRQFFSMIESWRLMQDELSVPQLVEKIVEKTGYLDHLESDDPTTSPARSENISELINSAYAFDEASDGGTLAQFLEQTALTGDADTIEDDQGVVRMMTVHAAKGLEFPFVIIVGVEENLMPHASNLDDESNLEEERRLFYVALTRAEQHAVLLHARMRRRFGQRDLCLPSRFLSEIPEELVDVKEIAIKKPTLSSFLNSTKLQKRSRPAVDVFRDDVSQVDGEYFEGQQVIHPSMGQGKIERVEGSGENTKLTIDFPGGVRKHYLAKYAKLSTID